MTGHERVSGKVSAPAGRVTRRVALLACFFLAGVFVAGCGGGAKKAETVKGVSRPAASVTASEVRELTWAPKDSGFGPFAPRAHELATIPADLFQIQDRADRKKEFGELLKRMIGDLEDEVKWQEMMDARGKGGTKPE